MKSNRNEISAEELLEKVAGGCHESLRELHDRFAGALIRIATGITRDPSEAKDVVQDSFIAVWRNPRRYDPRYGMVSSWLFRITRNRALDSLRKSKRIAATALRASLESRADFTAPPDNMRSVADTTAWVADVLKKLPAKQRDSLVLAYFDGLSQTEIAERLGEPLGTVKSRIRRGIECARSMG